MKRYRAVAPSANYSGKTCGIRFDDGKATFDDLTVREDIGLSADQIAKIMVNDFHYDVSVINEAGVPQKKVAVAG